jgi:Transposase DDE domain
MSLSIASALQQIKGDLARHLDPAALHDVCAAAGLRWRQRRLDPITTIQLFVLQILHGNTALSHLRHLAGQAFTPSAYCQARTRLPCAVLQQLLRRVTDALRPATDEGRWHGHRTFHLDGSSFSMPDTPALQRAFGQPSTQAAGCGFPVAHLLTLFHAGTGLLLKTLAAPLQTHDMAQVAPMHPELQAGDVLVGDRGLCSYAHLALLAQRQVQGIFRMHQAVAVDFTPGRPHNGPGQKYQPGRPRSRWLRSQGAQDQVVEWFKPQQRPVWMSGEAYAALPASLLVRELRYPVTTPGHRTREVTLVTTLLDAALYPAEELAELYRQRWQVETNLRHLKQTLKMDVLRCESEEGVLKELTVFTLVYNLVRAVMGVAAQRQAVAVERISFVDALRWLTTAQAGTPLPDLIVNPQRAGRVEPRSVKRRRKPYPHFKCSRQELRNRLLNKELVA